MATGDPRRAGRPRTSVLSRARIADATLAVVDETGDFTLPEVARRLGVQPASLYHHVDGRAGAIELLRARLGELIDLTPLDLRPWDLALRTWFGSYRDVFAAHPRVAPLLTTNPVRTRPILVAYDKIVTILEEADVPRDEVMMIMTAIENFVIGSALDLAAPEVMWELPDDIDVPHLASALAAQAGTGVRADRAFDFGLETLLATIHSRRSGRPQA